MIQAVRDIEVSSAAGGAGTARLSALTCLGKTALLRQDHESVNLQTKEVLLGLGLLHDEEHIRAYDKANFASLCAHVYPTASLKQLQACNDWNMWLFCFDDMVDSIGGRYEGKLDEMKRVAIDSLISLRYGVKQSEPLARYALHIRNLLLDLASERWLLRFSDAVEDYLFNGTFKAAQNHLHNHVAGVPEYIAMRVRDSGLGTVIRMAEMVCGGELPDSLWHDPCVLRMRRLCEEASSLHNDLFSYEKEVLWNHNPNNLVHVVMVNRKLGFSDAARLCIDMINARYDEFSRMAATMPSFGREVDGALRRFVAGMSAWIEGSADWQMMSGRYSSPTSPFVELVRS
ncbi:terpene synthase family protein [Sorangium sp. So ce1389]|uniref:terpene synthase family protein n=1 Tax=Sorangium sp. So ce1389 TaxID=3133336 RepID=UPI003F6048D5